MRRGVLATALAAIALFGGCLGAPGGTGTTTREGPPTTGDTPPPTSTTPRPSQPAVDVHVVDSNPGKPRLIEGGIAATGPGDDGVSARYYVTTVPTRSEAEARFDRRALGPDGLDFLDATDFGTASLVVVQISPHSSVPDHRVESVHREDGSLALTLNDSSPGRTDDVTVETVLVRIDGPVPESVTVTTDDGVSWSTAEGVVTRTAAPPTTDEPVELPYRSADPAENVAEARGLLVENAANDTAGYDLEVEYLEVPECRAETPPCSVPAREVGVLRAAGKLPVGGSERFPHVAARRGLYTVAVTAEVPGPNGSRRTVRGSFQWTIDEGAGDVQVRILSDGVQVVEREDERG